MEAALSVIGVAALAFVATNLDNRMLLIGIASRADQPFASIVAGALLASIATLCLGVSAALATDLVPQCWLGILGVVPIARGLRELTPETSLEPMRRRSARWGSRVCSSQTVPIPSPRSCRTSRRPGRRCFRPSPSRFSP